MTNIPSRSDFFGGLEIARSSASSGSRRCKYAVYDLEGHFVRCGRCDGCVRNHVHHWSGRAGAEAFWVGNTRFVTLTFRDENLLDAGRHVDCIKRFMERLRYRYGPVKRIGSFEYGSKTGRPHLHLLLFSRSIIDIPLNVSTDFEVWPHGTSYWQVPRTIAGSVGYQVKYALKEGSLWLRPSNGLGKPYLLNYAAAQARHRGLLITPRGLVYTVPGVRKVSRDTWSSEPGLWRYSIPQSHPYAREMVEVYVRAYLEHHGKEPEFDQFRRISADY